MIVTEREKLQDSLLAVTGGSAEVLKRLTKEILDVLTGTWEDSLHKYLNQSKHVFRNIREQRYLCRQFSKSLIFLKKFH